ncbi:unnamed protein product [Musa acuminata subsp. malaccensis]|uniref:(wild Malaysian banana) hypothetical protein n=1 Tax=Musa acuminata subsp. malaccensis TaxID=214687 RepID=A0A804L9P9_MUSAM|nr:PREDICTED: uncharacterized protein LOC103972037 [Musa acuminata subsp. malaccensis]CAG1865091.1 unnamed protein product [Musa acuminata subsp. malaccensis]
MGSMWRKAKRAMGFNLCVHVPRAMGEEEEDDGCRLAGLGYGRRASDAAATAMSSPAGSSGASEFLALMPSTPTPSSGGLRLPKSGIRSSKKTCAICLGSMKVGDGHALFTAECSHKFHFHCITSNVKHGNYVCPLCKATWKEIPFQGSLSSEHPHGRARVNPVNWPQEEGRVAVVHRLPPAESANRWHHQFSSGFRGAEPTNFNDDEPLDILSETARSSQQNCPKIVEVNTHPEFSAIQQSASLEDFAVLIHLKAPHVSMKPSPSRNLIASSTVPQNSRAPIDLVTVLDVSGSMAGTKLALLKRAMSFVIQNLGPSDRLSVIAFSSTARRLFHLCRMSDSGRQQALQAVNSLVSSGGTNIAEGLRKGIKVIEERKEKNSVCSIILLSDGRDTYTFSSSASGAQHSELNYKSLVPSSILGGTAIPVHTFGFGVDHDSAAMHTIATVSGGTFSFIESEVLIQNAFAQCIGGLLSVVVQEMWLDVECMHPGVRLAPIKSGSYRNQLSSDARTGFIYVGDLYADEERDFLVSVNVPPHMEEILLLKVASAYRDPISNDIVHLEVKEVRIQRPEVVLFQTPSIEVDRERNRIQTAVAISDARAAAERGALSDAVSILEQRRKILSESLAAQSNDRLCLALDAELREMQGRMASRQRYEASGRAYVLSGLSSHSSQRATMRGDSTYSETLIHAYQTPLMVDMLRRSQTSCYSARSPAPPMHPTRSIPSQLQPR